MEAYPGSQRVCEECGSPIEPGATFCYACGANYKERAPKYYYEAPYGDHPPQEMYEQPRAAPAVSSLEIVAASISRLIQIWVFMSIVLGMLSLIVGPALAELIEQTYGTEVPVSEIVKEGLFLLISGLAALVSSILLRKLKQFWVCFACCIAAALTSYPGMGGIAGVFTAVVGLYMSMAIMRCRPAFKA